MAFFTDAIICQHFLQETQVLHIFVRLKTLVLFFICFLAFYEFQCLLYKNTFVLTFIMGISYFVLAWRRLKTIKLKQSMFFYQPPVSFFVFNFNSRKTKQIVSSSCYNLALLPIVTPGIRKRNSASNYVLILENYSIFTS